MSLTWQDQQMLRRQNNIEVTSAQRDSFVNTAAAHYSAGNTGHAIVGITMVGNMDTLNEIGGRLDVLEQKSGIVRQEVNANEAPATDLKALAVQLVPLIVEAMNEVK